jgi:hypothetical protein
MMILLLTVGLAAVDVLIRLLEARVSGNLAHIAEIPQIINQARQSPEPSLLLLGNSLTNNGTDAQFLQANLKSVSVAKVTPDATDLWDWQCILRHQLVSGGAGSIRHVVIGTAWHLLSDQAAVDPSRLGALFCRFSDLSSPSSIGLHASSDIGEFMLARISRTYALRDTLRNRLFKIVVPSYQKFAGEAGSAPAGKPDKTTPASNYTYTRLAALAEQMRRSGVTLVVLSMPIPESYAIDAGLQDLARRGKVALYDYRVLAGIERASFIDSMHLGANGRAVLSARLAADLAAVVPVRP